MKKVTLSLALFLIAFSFTAQADVYVKSKVMNGMGTNETWTSGKKQRMSADVAGFGNMMGSVITIIRADKGVEWQINPKLQAYQERSLAIPYEKGNSSNAMDVSGMKKLMEDQKAEEGASACSSIKKSGPRSFAGITAQGYSADCGGDAPKTTLWIADSNQQKAKQAFEEMENFQKAHAEAMYKNYPPAEKERLMEMMKLLGTSMGGGLMGIPDPSKLPHNMVMAMEGAGMDPEGNSQNQMILEVTDLNIVSSDPSHYEVPAGFKKVDNLAELQQQQMMNQMSSGEMKLSDLMKGFENMGKEMGIPEDAGEEAPSAEEIQQMDQMGQASAQFVKNQMQTQGVWNAQGQLPTNAPQEAWQQGLYDQAPANTGGAYIPPAASNQSRQNSGNTRQPGASPNPARDTLREVNQMLQNVQGIAAQFSGAASSFGSMQVPGMDAYAPQEYYEESESYDDYQDSGDYEQGY